MLDALIKLTEKFTELSKYRAERRERHFEKLVVPIYDGMIKVHQDYLSMFDDALRSLSAGTPFKDVAISLSRARLDDEAQRHAILNQANGLLDLDGLETAKPFLRAVVNYFRDSPFSGGNTPSNMLLQTLHALEGEVVVPDLLFRSDPRESIERTIEMTLDLLRENWTTLSSEFVKQKAQALQ
jgi:hypothetical protein